MCAYVRTYIAYISASIHIRIQVMKFMVVWFKKGTFPSTPWRYMGAQRYSSTLSLTWTQDRCEWLTSRPGRFIPGKGFRNPLNRRLSRSQNRCTISKRENPVPSAGIRSLDRPSHILIGIPTEVLCWISRFKLNCCGLRSGLTGKIVNHLNIIEGQ